MTALSSRASNAAEVRRSSALTAAALRGGSDAREGPGHIVQGAYYAANLAKLKQQLGSAATPSSRLQLIADFDLTLTAPGSLQCHHMFGK